MNRLDQARRDLAAALEPVLPGRTSPYPPTAGRQIAPYVYIDQPELERATIGQRSRVTVATFPVWIVYDGTDRAQIAGLDDLTSKVWDAIEVTTGAVPMLSRRDSVPITSDNATGAPLKRYRAAVVSVEVTVAATTLCVPDVAASPIPPEPILQEA